MIDILVTDDHTLLREGLKQILAANPDIRVAGEASDGFQALTLLRQRSWDMILLDMSMPGRSGIELIKQIKSEFPKLPILVLSMHKEEEYAVRSIRAGASGYLCKDSASQLLLNAIRKVAAGGHFISPEVASELAFNLIRHDDQPPHTLLSTREFQILRLIAAGVAVTEMAQQLNLSVKTVSTYKARILQKMQMTSSAEVIRYAIKHELMEESPER